MAYKSRLRHCLHIDNPEFVDRYDSTCGSSPSSRALNPSGSNSGKFSFKGKHALNALGLILLCR